MIGAGEVQIGRDVRAGLANGEKVLRLGSRSDQRCVGLFIGL